MSSILMLFGCLVGYWDMQSCFPMFVRVFQAIRGVKNDLNQNTSLSQRNNRVRNTGQLTVQLRRIRKNGRLNLLRAGICLSIEHAPRSIRTLQSEQSARSPGRLKKISLKTAQISADAQVICCHVLSQPQTALKSVQNFISMGCFLASQLQSSSKQEKISRLFSIWGKFCRFTGSLSRPSKKELHPWVEAAVSRPEQPCLVEMANFRLH